MSFGAGLLLLIWVIASILANGIALLRHFTKLRGLDCQLFAGQEARATLQKG